MISSLSLAPFASQLLIELNAEAENAYPKTWQSLHALRQSLIAENPSHLLLLSPHTHTRSHALGLNHAQSYTVDLLRLGGHEQAEKIKGDLALSYRLKEKLESLNILALETRDLSILECVGLRLFWPIVKKMQLVPLKIRHSSAAQLFSWGHLFGNALADLTEKIAILGLTELSFPANKMLKGLAHKCDQRIIEALKTNEAKKLIRSLPLEYLAIKDGSRDVAVFMMGLTQNLPGHWEILSNETLQGQRTVCARWQWR